VLADESDPKAWLDRVDDDEFPLSIFYTSLAQKLEAGPGEHPPTTPRPGPDAPAASAPSPHSPFPKAAA
jgi:hypothetical protein